jgi:hypothetical protein
VLLGLVLGALGGAASTGACSTGTSGSAFDAGPADAVAPEDVNLPPSLDAQRADVVVPPGQPLDASVCQDEPISLDRVVGQACGGTADAGTSTVMRVCFAKPDTGDCDAAYSRACVVSKYRCGLVQAGDRFGCGPLTDRPEACCYEVFGSCPIGRPFTVEGDARLASVEPNRGWSGSEALPEVSRLDETTRAALARAWTDEARTEHASVASFTRMVLELLSLGAPAELVGETLGAAEDERRHAIAAFSFASHYGQVELAPGPLDIRECLAASSAAEIAERLAGEGCVAETVSALLVGEAAERAEDPAVRAHLTRVAEEESAHALLAWKTLAWILARQTSDRAEVHARVTRVFARAEHYVGIGSVIHEGTADALRAHGQLSPSVKRSIARSVLGSVVAPAARAALARVDHDDARSATA